MSIIPMMYAVTPDGYTRLEPEGNVVMNNRWKLKTDRDSSFAKRLFDDFSRCRYDVSRLVSPFYNPHFKQAKQVLQQFVSRQQPENMLTQEESLLKTFLKIREKENRDSSCYETTNVLKCARDSIRSIHYFMARAVVGVLRINLDDDNYRDIDKIWNVLDLIDEDDMDLYMSQKSEGLFKMKFSDCKKMADNIAYAIMIEGVELEDYLVLPKNRDFLVAMYYFAGEYYIKRPDLFAMCMVNVSLFPQLYAEMKGCMVSVTDISQTDWYCPFLMRRPMLNCADGAMKGEKTDCMITLNYQMMRMSSLSCINLVVAAYDYYNENTDDDGKHHDIYLMEINEKSFNVDKKEALKLLGNHNVDSCYFELGGLFKFPVG